MSVIEKNNPDLWKNIFPFPGADSHKYTRGTALIRGGALMTGATRVAARAAQRAGAGLVTLAAPLSALPIYAESLESVIVRPCNDIKEWKELVQDARNPALLIGPGLGTGKEQKEEILVALGIKHPIVLDADALTTFADSPDILFKALHPGCVMTPHEGEFSRLFGDIEGDKVARVKAAVKRTQCVVLIKGAETVIGSPNGTIVINQDAPPWLATAGSGDVLAGIILGLVAQKMPIFQAAAAAVWIHAEVAAHHGIGLIAEDLVTGLPPILQRIFDLSASK